MRGVAGVLWLLTNLPVVLERIGLASITILEWPLFLALGVALPWYLGGRAILWAARKILGYSRYKGARPWLILGIALGGYVLEVTFWRFAFDTFIG
jgi:hypothetical protein